MRTDLRRQFFRNLLVGLSFMWPVLSGLVTLIAALGLVIGRLEDWPLGDGLYFAFVTGLTIGYGHFLPTTFLARVLAIAIGFCGVLLTGLVAAVGVQALQQAWRGLHRELPPPPAG